MTSKCVSCIADVAFRSSTFDVKDDVKTPKLEKKGSVYNNTTVVQTLA